MIVIKVLLEIAIVTATILEVIKDIKKGADTDQDDNPKDRKE